MYILKNAYLSIIRNKVRNILIGIIILVIACASSVTIAIKNSANSLIQSYEQQYEIKGTLQINRDSLINNFDPNSQDKTESKKEMIEQFNNIENLTIEDIEDYGNSEYVKNYYYTNSIGLNSSNIETATSTQPENSNQQPNNIKKPDNNFEQNQVNSTDFTLTGYSSYEAMENFINGSYTITDGEVSNDFKSNNCVINSELATLNNLKVGDTITLINPNDETKTYDLTISGIFTENENSSDNRMDMFSKSANTIITNTNFVNTITAEDSTLINNLNPTFIIKDKDSIEKFETELKSKGLSEYLTLNTNLEQVESATDSISNVATFATTFLIITLVIGAIVLFILNMINVRERKYEIGVLRTIGMKKSTLTLQFITELLIVTIIFLIIGTGIGALISVPTANMLLENEINSSQEAIQNVNENFGGNMMPGNNKGRFEKNEIINGIANVEQIDSINAIVDFKVLFELLGIGIALTLISSLASMISIQRFSPLTILKERS